MEEVPQFLIALIYHRRPGDNKVFYLILRAQNIGSIFSDVLLNDNTRSSICIASCPAVLVSLESQVLELSHNINIFANGAI